MGRALWRVWEEEFCEGFQKVREEVKRKGLRSALCIIFSKKFVFKRERYELSSYG